MVTPRSTPRKKEKSPKGRDSYRWTIGESLDSPTFSELMPGRHSVSSRDVFSSIAERRQQSPPSPLYIPDAVSPLGEGRDNDDASSVYSHQPTPARPSPLHLSRARSHSVNRPRRSKSSGDGLRKAHAMELHSPTAPQIVTVSASNSRSSPNNQQVTQNTPFPPTPFSPLQFYFRGTDYPSTKKGEKTMIGDNGWLERTDRAVVEQVAKTPQKKTGILDSIKKMAKEVVSQQELEVLS